MTTSSTDHIGVATTRSAVDRRRGLHHRRRRVAHAAIVNATDEVARLIG